MFSVELNSSTLLSSFINFNKKVFKHLKKLVTMPSADGEALSVEEKTAEREFYKSVHDKFDEDNSGGLDFNEFNELIRSNNATATEIVRGVFEAADRNGDGVVDHEELQQVINDKRNNKLFQRYITTYIRFILPPRHHRRCMTVDENGITLENGVCIDAVDGKYEENYSCCPPPLAMMLISAFEITCYITDEKSGAIAQMFEYNPRGRHQAWRFLTYMFVHSGYMHILMNILVQLVLGVPLEMVHNWWRVLLVYFSGVIAGSLATSVTDPTVSLVGASGGVYALITAHIATILMNWNEMSFPLIQLMVFLVITSVDFGSAVYNRYCHTGENIGYTAHLAGAIAGLLVGIWVLKNFTPTKKETYIWWTALLIYIVCMGVMILMNVFWTDHFQLT